MQISISVARTVLAGRLWLFLPPWEEPMVGKRSASDESTMLAELLPCSVDPHILAAHPRFMVALAGVVLTVAVAVWKGVVALVDLFLGSNTARLTFGVLEWLWVTLVGFWSWSGNSSSSN